MQPRKVELLGCIELRHQLSVGQTRHFKWLEILSALANLLKLAEPTAVVGGREAHISIVRVDQPLRYDGPALSESSVQDVELGVFLRERLRDHHQRHVFQVCKCERRLLCSRALAKHHGDGRLHTPHVLSYQEPHEVHG